MKCGVCICGCMTDLKDGKPKANLRQKTLSLNLIGSQQFYSFGYTAAGDRTNVVPLGREKQRVRTKPQICLPYQQNGNAP